ncbi:uncharacterized protein LOC122529244 [Frieseomelitta varia]|uniref:uncharacterized protein LOC122529244 n=1 Tax=Frieseomelitta varia TaxID=561572 RepID=UPI001CB6B390|nr:uncharacterized protein LOC122529244 [Frieseomelitta varia]
MERQPVVNIETGNKKRILKMKGKEREPVTVNEANDDRSVSSGARENSRQLSDTDGIPDCHTDRYRKNAGDFRMKFRPPIFQRGCSKHCTGIKRDDSDSSFELTVCGSTKGNHLAYGIKRSKRMLEQFSNQVKKTTRKSMKKIRKVYKNIAARRVMGYNCDLRECPSTLMECSTTSCTKPAMLFSKYREMRGNNATRDKAEECDSAEGTDHEFKVLKDQSVGTNVEKETST